MKVRITKEELKKFTDSLCWGCIDKDIELEATPVKEECEHVGSMIGSITSENFHFRCDKCGYEKCGEIKYDPIILGKQHKELKRLYVKFSTIASNRDLLENLIKELDQIYAAINELKNAHK